MEPQGEVEMGNSPELDPSIKMVEKVKSKAVKTNPSRLFIDWTHGVVAITALIILVITYTSLIKPDLIFEPAPKKLPPVDTRQVSLSGADYRTLAPQPPETGRARGREPFQQLDFQIYRAERNEVDTLDLRYELLDPLLISAQDSYRLILKPNFHQVVYLYLQQPTGKFQDLHGQLNTQRYPEGRRKFLPEKPNWFYHRGDPGDYKFYLISSSDRIYEIEELYDQINWVLTEEEKQAATLALQNYINQLIATTENDDIQVWQLSFQFGDW